MATNLSGGSPECRVCNSTGGDLEYLFNHPWEGGAPSSYPDIPNGPPVSFYARNSVEAVVYRGVNKNGIYGDWMFAWKTAGSPNCVCTMIREKDYFKTANWDQIYSSMVTDHASDAGNGWWKSTISVNAGSPAIVQATLTLVGDATIQAAQQISLAHG